MDEQMLWKGTPSQAVHFGTYILCGLFCWLVVPLFIALGKYLSLKFRRYEVTSERIRVTTGVFSRKTEDLELYRVKDLTLEEPFWLRMFGAGNVLLRTTDLTSPVLALEGIPGAPALHAQIRQSVEASRQRRGIRGLEMA